MCIYVFAHSAAGCMYKNACRLPVNLPEISRVSDMAQFVLWHTGRTTSQPKNCLLGIASFLQLHFFFCKKNSFGA